MSRVNVIYHHFPHYRRPVMRAMAESRLHAYTFWGDIVDYQGIKAFKGDERVQINRLRFRFDDRSRRVDISHFWPAVLDRRADALIVIGNANMPATWIIAIVGRMTGKKVLFWAHGWRQAESAPKAFLRRLYYGLADKVLLYGHRARELATAGGFPTSKLVVIYNSLDWETSRPIDEALSREEPDALRQQLQLPLDRPVLICSARLSDACRFDLLIEAGALLAKRNMPTKIILIGDGPLLQQLKNQALAAGVDATFTGAIYDEAVLGAYYHASDITVSPGKVGLTAVHSMTYGIPVITHDNLNEQMPEFETIQPGTTGAFFRQGDATDLADVIENWLRTRSDRLTVGAACRAVVRDKYNPDTQTRLIDAAITAVLA